MGEVPLHGSAYEPACTRHLGDTDVYGLARRAPALGGGGRRAPNSEGSGQGESFKPGVWNANA